MSLNKRILVPILVITLLTIQMMSPISALADDGAPPPATEETPVPEETETPVEEGSTAEAAPVPDETTETPPTTEGTATTEETTSEDLTVAEALEQVPDETEIVVVNEEGEIEPLATEEAAEIIEEADPIWCPVGTDPTTANAGTACSPSYTSMTDLLTWLTTNDPGQAGVIWIEKTYDSAAEGVAGFTLDGTTLTNMNDYALTIQGGWNGLDTTTVDTSSPSTFTGDYLHIINWNADVTLNDIVVDGAAGDGIKVTTSGDITLKNVTSSNNTAGGSGATLNSSGNGQITLNGTNQFSHNNGHGLQATTTGNITLNNITANENTQRGVWLDNFYVGSGTGDITLTGTNVFNGNSSDGLYAISKGEIWLNNVTAGENAQTGNGKYGVYLLNYSGTGKVTLTGTNTFNGNTFDGLYVSSNGEIRLNNVTAGQDALTGNGGFGVNINTPANITVSDITANNNGSGAYLYNGGAGGQVDSKITITGTNAFNNNGSNGLTANANGDITLSNITANNNGSSGLSLTSNGGTIQLDGVNTLDGNGEGMNANTAGIIIINNLTASNSLWVDGANLTTIGDITINCSAFNSNAGYGFQVFSSPSLTLNGVTFDGLNGSGNYNYSGTLVENPIYNCNPGGGGKKTVNPTYPSLPVNQVSTAGGAAELNCSDYKGTQLSLPDGSFVYFPCPISDSASVSALEPENLPEGLTLHSGLTTAVTKDGATVTTLPTHAMLSFLIPAGVDASSLSILYFDGSEWIELSDGLTLDNGKRVGLGGYVSTDGLYFQATVNFGGDFVLVSK